MVKRVSKTQTITVSLASTSGPRHSILKGTFSGLRRVIVPGAPGRLSSSTLIGPETWLKLDVETIFHLDHDEVETYEETLSRYLRTLDEIENVQIPNFWRRCGGDKDWYGPNRNFNPYEDMGVLDRGKVSRIYTERRREN